MSGYPDHHLLYALTEQEVSLQLDEAALAEAQRYYRDGHVRKRSIVGSTVMGLVEQSALDSQVAEVSVHDGEIYIDCTCEHRGPDICAHVGAVLLTRANHR